MKAVCGTCRAYRGKIRIVRQTAVEAYKATELFHGNCLAMLPQDPKSLFVKKTVREDLEEMCQRRGGKIDQRSQNRAKLSRCMDSATPMISPAGSSSGQLWPRSC